MDKRTFVLSLIVAILAAIYVVGVTWRAFDAVEDTKRLSESKVEACGWLDDASAGLCIANA